MIFSILEGERKQALLWGAANEPIAREVFMVFL